MGLPAWTRAGVSKKSLHTDFDTSLTLCRVLCDFVDTLFDTPGREAQEDLFETFWAFRAHRGSALLYMPVPIAKKTEFKIRMFLGTSGLPPDMNLLVALKGCDE